MAAGIRKARWPVGIDRVKREFVLLRPLDQEPITTGHSPGREMKEDAPVRSYRDRALEIDLAAIEPADRDRTTGSFFQKPQGDRDLPIGREPDRFHQAMMGFPGIELGLAVVHDHLERLYRVGGGRSHEQRRGHAGETRQKREKRQSFDHKKGKLARRGAALVELGEKNPAMKGEQKFHGSRIKSNRERRDKKLIFYPGNPPSNYGMGTKPTCCAIFWPAALIVKSRNCFARPPGSPFV